MSKAIEAFKSGADWFKGHSNTVTKQDLRAMEERLSKLILRVALEKEEVKLRELERRLRESSDSLEASINTAQPGESGSEDKDKNHDSHKEKEK